MQSIFPLDDGWALKLTIAKYYTPSHRVIQELGITPDIYVPISDQEEAALLIKRSIGEWNPRTKPTAPPSRRSRTPNLTGRMTC